LRADALPLVPPEDVADAVLRFVTDSSLNGRVAVLDGKRPFHLAV
jgi:hypothetical protein